MSLFKRGGIWWSYFYRDGIRHQDSTGASNRRQAEAIEAKLKEEVNKQRFQIVQADPHITFGELAACFLAGGSARPHHLHHLKFLLPFFSDMAAVRITRSLVDEFRSARRKQNPALMDSSLNRDLSVLRRILYWSLDEQLIAANPLARMKLARERRTRRQVLSVAEEAKLLSAAKGHLRNMIIVAIDTGMRRGEITSQRWEDVDLSQGLLYVTRSKTPEGELREIPLTARLLELLIQQRKTSGLVITYKGAPVRIVKRTWKTALKNAQVRHMRFHDLRHSFNTRLMEAGVLQEVRMALMGHSSGSKVHATYTHIELPVKREAIRKLELWKVQQEQLLKEQDRKENTDARTETDRSETGSLQAAGQQAGPQTVEEENACRGGVGASRKAQGRDRRNGRGVESQKAAARQIRASQKAV